jgi:hypothetical protein
MGNQSFGCCYDRTREEQEDTTLGRRSVKQYRMQRKKNGEDLDLDSDIESDDFRRAQTTLNDDVESRASPIKFEDKQGRKKARQAQRQIDARASALLNESVLTVRDVGIEKGVLIDANYKPVFVSFDDEIGNGAPSAGSALQQAEP